MQASLDCLHDSIVVAIDVADAIEFKPSVKEYPVTVLEEARQSRCQQSVRKVGQRHSPETFFDSCGTGVL